MKSLKFISLTISALTAMLVIGCSNSTAPTSLQNNENGSVVVEKYVYSDKQYEISYNKVGENLELMDGPDNAVVADLMANPTSGLAVDPKEENTFWIYKDADEMKKVIGIINTKYDIRSLAKKAANNYVLLCEHDYAGGYMLPIYSTTTSLPTFNDETSSLELSDVAVALCEHDNFGGQSLFFYPDYVSGYGYYKRIQKLSDFTMRWIGSTRITWNDQVSSLYVFPLD